MNHTGYSARAGEPAKLVTVRSALPFSILLLAGPLLAPLPAPAASGPPALVDRALANELRAAEDSSHPMRYRLRKSSPRLTTTREIFETKDGGVARLLSINDMPLSAADEQKEQQRLAELDADPGKQRHRKRSEDTDRGRALKAIRELPTALLYQDAGPGQGPAGPVEKFTFRPNPAFSPPDLETQVLTAVTGEIWIDPAQARVVHLDAHLQQDVDFGWGILGRLNKGGWIAVDQAEVAPGLWRTAHFRMAMTARVIFRTRSFDTTEETSRFVPLPAGMGYRQAIAMMRESGTGR